jgi:hypothetical protein
MFQVNETDFKQTDLNAKSGGEIKLEVGVDKVNIKAMLVE